MNFKPLGKRVLVERQEQESKTASGLIIPDNAKEKPLSGKVVAISSCVKEEASLKEGSVVLFGKYKGDEVKINDKEYIILELDDILGVVG